MDYGCGIRSRNLHDSERSTTHRRFDLHGAGDAGGLFISLFTPVLNLLAAISSVPNACFARSSYMALLKECETFYARLVYKHDTPNGVRDNMRKPHSLIFREIL